MSPHRIGELVRAQVSAPIEPAIALTAIIAAAVGAVFSDRNVFLLLLLGAAIMLDQASGMAKAILITPHGKDWYDWEKVKRGGVKKLLMAIGFLVAASIEAALMTVPQFGELLQEWTPLTTTSILYLLVAVWGSTLRNVMIVRELRGFSSFVLRRMDALKLGEEPPARRPYDKEAIEVERSLETTDGRSFHEAARDIDRRGRKADG